MWPGPLLDGGAKGAWSEVSPIEGPFHPEPGKVCPFESDRKPPSELASTQDHPIRPPLPGGPLLDAGAEGARLEVPPIEGPSGPVAGKVPP